MATSYSQRYGRPLGVSNRGLGGAGLNLGVEALCGETEMVTVFDDFNYVLPASSFSEATGDSTTAIWEDNGWVLTDVGTPTGDAIYCNSVATVTERFDSCLKIVTATTEDEGGCMNLDIINADLASGANHLTSLSSRINFPHIWIAETAAGAGVNDNTTYVFACRVGLRADITTSGSGDWDSKMFIGWAEAGDTNILAAATGLPVVSSQTGPIIGFAAHEDGSITLNAQRTIDTALAEGTNFTTMIAAGGVDGTTALGAVTAGDTMWFDLALRMDITDQSSATANGAITGYYRRVADISALAPGRRDGRLAGDGPGAWVQHSTVLENQCPNNDVALVPTIEAINGPTAGTDGVVFVDWWCMGISRYSLNLGS